MSNRIKLNACLLALLDTIKYTLSINGDSVIIVGSLATEYTPLMMRLPHTKEQLALLDSVNIIAARWPNKEHYIKLQERYGQHSVFFSIDTHINNPDIAHIDKKYIKHCIIMTR